MNSRTILIFSGLLGAAGILLGAFGAHALPRFLADLPPEELAAREDWLQTGVTYHMYHALALLALGLGVAKPSDNEENSTSPLRFRGAVIGWVLGIVVFSGCLYVMTLTGQKWLGRFVPIGGVSFVIGWIMLMVGAK